MIFRDVSGLPEGVSLDEPEDPAHGRFESTVERALQDVLARGLADPRVRGIITVTGVDISPDRRDAKVWISVMPEERQDLTMHGLKAATGFVRKKTMERVRSRTFPRIRFALDKGLKRQAKVMEAIGRATAERPAGPVGGLEDSSTGGSGDGSGDGPAGTGDS